MTTIKQALHKAALMLERIDAEILLSHTLQVSRTFLYAHGDDELTPEAESAFNMLVKTRQQGQPIAYLIGEKEFWSLSLSVNPSTLIPRPETELLVEIILQLSPPTHCRLLELGTGSGAISIALAHTRPHWHITATDISTTALKTAKDNATRLSLSNIEFMNANWFQGLALERFDVIVSNPPYIEDNDPHLHQGDLRFEPRNALASGPDGLDALRAIISDAPRFLKPQGLLLLEHGYQQAQPVATLLQAHQFENITCHLDIQGHPRLTSAHLGTLVTPS